MTTPPRNPAEPDAPEPVFSCVEDWMAEYFLPMFKRPLGGEIRWCPRWWAHPEAVTRLTALWRSWESLRLDPATGIADWLRDYLDHHLAVMCGPRGPFFQCDPDGGHLEGDQFPCDPVDYEILDGLP